MDPGRTRSPAPGAVFFLWGAAGATARGARRGRGARSPACYAAPPMGFFFPRLEMYGPIVTRGPAGRRSVALTFDDGPHPVTTRRILAVLAATRHRATFFVLGVKARRHPEVVREIHAAGHTLGVHGDRHVRVT